MEAPNIILITVDCLRADHLGCYGYDRDTSPNIDSLASKGALFSEAISNGGSTPNAFPSILASALPPLDRYEANLILQRSTTLAELLREAGYGTAAFHSNVYLSRVFNYDKGFNIFRDNLGSLNFLQKLKSKWVTSGEYSLSSKVLTKLIRFSKFATTLISGPPYLRSETLVNQAAHWLVTQKERFFLWLHLMDVHHPYMPLLRYRQQFCSGRVGQRQMTTLYYKYLRQPERLSLSEIKTLIDLYDADVKYVDDMIGRLLDTLGEYLPSTAVIITADHGEEINEHGNFGHQSVYDGVLRVPLIIVAPGVKAGTVVKSQVSLLDLSPTVAELVGIKSAQDFMGQSLLPLIKREETKRGPAISTFVHPVLDKRNIAYRIPGWKYICTESLDGALLAEETYNLRNDPEETKNLHGVDIREVGRFELEAKDKLNRFKRLKTEDKTAYEKQRIKVKLGKLGRL